MRLVTDVIQQSQATTASYEDERFSRLFLAPTGTESHDAHLS